MAKIWIQLQKSLYYLGEEVSGTVTASLEKPISQRSASIYIIGKERTEITYQRTGQPGISQPQRTGIGAAIQTYQRIVQPSTPHSTVQQTHTETAVQESEFLHQEYPMPLPVGGDGKFMPGQHTAPFKFVLQQGLPPSYVGRHARIQYLIFAKIDVPLGIDVRESSVFTVVPASTQPYQSGPANAYSNSWGNPQSTGISFTLDKGQYARGEPVNGSISFRNPSSKDLRKIDLHLRWVEMAVAQGQRSTTEVMRQDYQVPAGGKNVQGDAPFNITIPGQAPLTYEAALSNVRCSLTASMDIAWAGDVAATQTIRIVEGIGYAAQQPPMPIPQYPVGQVQPPQAAPPQTYQPPNYPPTATAGATCPHCGANLPKANAQYCPNCGSRLA